MEQSNQLIYKTDDIWQHKMSIDKIHVCKSGYNRRNVDDSPQTDRDREQNHASVFAYPENTRILSIFKKSSAGWIQFIT